MTIFDVLGREIYFDKKDFYSSGKHLIKLDLGLISQMKSHVLFSHFEIQDGQKKRMIKKKLILTTN